VEKDVSTLAEDSAARVARFDDDISETAGKAREDLTTRVKDGVSELSKGFEKLAGDAKETVVGVAETVKKDVGHGLSQYNAKAKEAAGKVPGGFGEKAAAYPWAAISIALGVGFLLGGLLKPARRLPEQL